MPTKIPVIKTTGDDYQLMFEEADVRKACALAKCGQEMIEECVANLKDGDNDCTTCYIILVNIIKAVPTYKKIKKEIPDGRH